MEFKEQSFVTLLLGNDINVYSVARAFHEAYGIRSTSIGKKGGAPCAESRMIDQMVEPDINNPETFVKRVNEFAAKQTKPVLLMGCGDNYVRLIAENKDKLADNIIAPYADAEMLNSLMDKEKFYELCDKHGIEYPATYVCTPNTMEVKPDFGAPYILKPCNGPEYFAHPFEGQKKVFKLDTLDELKQTVAAVYNSGYKDNLIIQDFIPGDDTYMRVLTNYSDKNAKVKLMCLGHVLLEEHTPYGIGNHAVIINEYDRELMGKFQALLEDIGYTGFSNFDIKYDRRDKKFKVFEINVRQGRSNFYVTGAGYNIAEYVVKDHVLNEDLGETVYADKENLWLVVPQKVAFDYIKPAEYRTRMKSLIRKGSVVNPLFYKGDDKTGRILRLVKQHFSHFAKYKKYLGK
ncbi:MAG: ATP-grasp domain-containing protein [Clostridia bacterium]